MNYMPWMKLITGDQYFRVRHTIPCFRQAAGIPTIYSSK